MLSVEMTNVEFQAELNIQFCSRMRSGGQRY
jgi:hypothetical protein